MLANTTAINFKTENTVAFRPHWIKTDRTTTDVAATPAIPFYEALAGLSVPKLDEIDQIILKLKAKELPKWIKKIEILEPFLNALNGSVIGASLTTELKDAISEYDGHRAMEIVLGHIELVLSGLAIELEDSVKNVIHNLPAGQSIWDEISVNRLYCFSFGMDSDNSPKLFIESEGYFEHFYAGVNEVDAKYRPYYVLLLNRLMMLSFGEYQHFAIEYQGHVFSPMNKENMTLISNFVTELESLGSDEFQSVLDKYEGAVLEEFLGEVEENILYGESIIEQLDENFDCGLDSVKEGLAFVEYGTMVSDCQCDAGFSLDDLATLEDCPYTDLFKAVNNALSLLSGQLDGLSMMDERYPFGVIVSLLTEKDISDEVQVAIDGVYESVFNAGEEGEVWEIDLQKPHWKDSVKTRSISMALIIALIEGVNRIRNVA